MSRNQTQIISITNPSGLAFEFLPNAAIKSIVADSIRVNLQTGSSFSKPGTQIYIRKRKTAQAFVPVLGSENSRWCQTLDNIFQITGLWEGIDYQCKLVLSGCSLNWKFIMKTTNTTDEPLELDMICVQDLSLKAANSGLINEYYVSQYLERRIFEAPALGSVICCRQNMKEGGGHPWLMMACPQGAISGTTDGMMFYGKTYRETGIPEALLLDKLPGEYAGESSVIALQEKPFVLAPNQTHTSEFMFSFLPDHPEASSEQDLDRLSRLMKEFGEPEPRQDSGNRLKPSFNLFNTAPFLPVETLSEDELNMFFGSERRHAERAEGELLSFFTGHHKHVVLKGKETLADRPHGHIMQAGKGLTPDESLVSSTAFMFGAFNSHLTQGNTNFNSLLSVCTSQFNLSPETGQRIFAEINGKYFLLGVPSAFEMGLNHCRWIYKHKDQILQVRTWTSRSNPQVNLDFSVIVGSAVRLLITHDFDASNGWKASPGVEPQEFVITPAKESMIAGKFPDARFRLKVQTEHTAFEAGDDSLLFVEPETAPGRLFVLQVQQTKSFCMSILAEVPASQSFVTFKNADTQLLSDCHEAETAWKNLSLNLDLACENRDISAFREILPWFGSNALIHYLTPYGLEQFGGAAWGTRDVAQGPVELLLTMQKYAEARQLLCTIFSNQHTDGGWPQWWMFDSYRHIRAHDAHGDVVYWSIIALSRYIKISGDLSILDEELPYYQPEGSENAEISPVREHMERLIAMIVASFIPGTSLVPFSGGDWNDSLQPVSKDLAARMISSWTVEMNYQAFREFEKAYEKAGMPEKARELSRICENIKGDFNKHLVRDGVLAGYGLVEPDGSISIMLHPQDAKTGIHYSVLPMNRGIISDIFTKEQGLHHQEVVEQHLKGPDGARLMDRPLEYKGGIQTIFQRAESSTFFGREIGLMYMHEHLRYAESLAMTGKADAFVKALRQAIPVAYHDVVSCADIRQANCYYSSSDAVFKNRYEADERYEEIISGNITLRGGWRVYSSGPGIFISIFVAHLLGLRFENGHLIVDPVLPFSFDGLTARMDCFGKEIHWKYHVKNNNVGPQKLEVNGEKIDFWTEDNKYRRGGATVDLQEFLGKLIEGENEVEIFL